MQALFAKIDFDNKHNNYFLLACGGPLELDMTVAKSCDFDT